MRVVGFVVAGSDSDAAMTAECGAPRMTAEFGAASSHSQIALPHGLATGEVGGRALHDDPSGFQDERID